MIATRAVDANGLFNFDHLKPGKYRLKVTTAHLIDFYVDSILKPNRRAKVEKEIVITIGRDLVQTMQRKLCGGENKEGVRLCNLKQFFAAAGTNYLPHVQSNPEISHPNLVYDSCFGTIKLRKCKLELKHCRKCNSKKERQVSGRFCLCVWFAKS